MKPTEPTTHGLLTSPYAFEILQQLTSVASPRPNQLLHFPKLPPVLISPGKVIWIS